MKKGKEYFSIIIPVHDGESTLRETFDSLIKQKNKKLVREIFIIDDGSSDNSIKEIKKFIKKKYFKIILIQNKYSLGLSKNYNKTIKICKTEYFIVFHQDIILKDKNCFSILYKKIKKNPDIFCFYPTLIHPDKFFNRYNFWQKLLFVRYINKKMPISIEKFDCFNREKMIEIGFFDERHFRTAGEDMDLIVRARKNKLLSKPSGIDIYHLHNINPKFTFKDFINKENQYAETKGVLLRLHGPFIPTYKSFFREIILLMFLVPHLRFFSLFCIFCYMFFYNIKIFREKDIRIMLVPALNLFLFFANIFYTLVGFIRGKQKI